MQVALPPCAHHGRMASQQGGLLPRCSCWAPLLCAAGGHLQGALLPAARRKGGVRALARPHAVAAQALVPQHLRLAQARARPQHRLGALRSIGVWSEPETPRRKWTHRLPSIVCSLCATADAISQHFSKTSHCSSVNNSTVQCIAGRAFGFAGTSFKVTRFSSLTAVTP